MSLEKMTKKLPDGCYHTSEFANLPERCDLPDLLCHKGHLWIVDGKEQQVRESIDYDQLMNERKINYGKSR